MSWAEFEPAIAAVKRPQTFYDAATEIGTNNKLLQLITSLGV
jgi:hypothetical protein